MNITRMMVPSSKYSLKCPYSMSPIGITVHNTANKASAKAEISYMIGNSSSTSFHYAVDGTGVVQGIEENRNAWHAGDGSGNGNRKTIGVEICYSTGTDAQFDASEKMAAKFLAMKLKEKGWTTKNLYRHQDWSGKRCPHKTLDKGWDRFVAMVDAEMKGTAATPTVTTPTVKPSTNTSTVAKYFDWIKELQAECNRQGFSKQDEDGIAGPNTLKGCPTLKKGAEGNITKIMQERIIAAGISVGGTKADGVFGANTKKGVIAFQKMHGLKQDGVCGPNTWSKILGL